MRPTIRKPPKFGSSIRSLGCAIASYINIIDPEIVVLAGGISIVGNTLMDPLMTVLDEVEWRPGGHQVPVVFGALDKWAGAVGAAYASKQSSQDESTAL